MLLYGSEVLIYSKCNGISLKRAVVWSNLYFEDVTLAAMWIKKSLDTANVTRERPVGNKWQWLGLGWSWCRICKWTEFKVYFEDKPTELYSRLNTLCESMKVFLRQSWHDQMGIGWLHWDTFSPNEKVSQCNHPIPIWSWHDQMGIGWLHWDTFSLGEKQAIGME